MQNNSKSFKELRIILGLPKTFLYLYGLLVICIFVDIVLAASLCYTFLKEEYPPILSILRFSLISVEN